MTLLVLKSRSFHLALRWFATLRAQRLSAKPSPHQNWSVEMIIMTRNCCLILSLSLSLLSCQSSSLAPELDPTTPQLEPEQSSDSAQPEPEALRPKVALAEQREESTESTAPEAPEPKQRQDPASAPSSEALSVTAGAHVRDSLSGSSGYGGLGLVGTGAGGGGKGPSSPSKAKLPAQRAVKRKAEAALVASADEEATSDGDAARIASAPELSSRGRGRAARRSTSSRRPWSASIAQLRRGLHGQPLDVNQDPLSSFSMDVDKSSYHRLRGALAQRSALLGAEVKVEGFVNAYPYQLEPPPLDAPEPFSLTAELSDSPWGPDEGGDALLRVALKAKELPLTERPRSHLVFLVDVSGSMCARGKLDLVKQSLTRLLGRLRPVDQLSLVTYSGTVKTLLKPSPADRKGLGRMKRAIARLRCAGSTAGGAGLERAYELAQEGWIEGGNNRVIVTTDGDFNMGISSVEEIKSFISAKRSTGVYLSMLGFGQSGYNEENMGALARSGNGNYAFIDSLEESERSLGRELEGTLTTLATDLKLQVEFNPAHVRAYRLLGYERRVMSAAEFESDHKDAAELGAGQQVTALYELYTRHVSSPPKIKTSYPCGERVVADNIDCPDREGDEGALPIDRSVPREWGVFKVRYKERAGAPSQRLAYPIVMGVPTLQEASHDHRVATALGLLAESLKSAYSLSYLKQFRRRSYQRFTLLRRSPYQEAQLLSLVTPRHGEELGDEQRVGLKDLRSVLKRLYKVLP